MGLSRLSIKARLIAAFSFVVVIVAALIAVATMSREKQAAAQHKNILTYEVIEEVNGLTDAIVNMETGARGFLLAGADTFLEPLTNGRQEFAAHFARISELSEDRRVHQKLAELRAAQQEWLTQAIEPAIGLRREVITGDATMSDIVALEREARGKKGMDAMRTILAEIEEIEQALLKQRAAVAEEAQTFTTRVLIGGGAIAVVLAIVMAIAIARSIVNPLRQVLRATEDLRAGDGDLTYQLPEMDAEFGDIARSLNGFIDKLHSVISTTKSRSASMSSGALQIARGNDDLNQRTQEQAAALEETASSMEEMTTTVKQNADNARQANQLSSNARAHAEKGGQVVQRTDIMDAVKRVSDIVAEIASASEEQAQGIDQVNNAVTQMDSMTQQNAALVEEASAASKVLEQQGQGLVAQVGQFRTAGKVTSHVAVPVATKPLATVKPISKPVSTPIRGPAKKSSEIKRAPVAAAPMAKASGGDWHEF